MTTSMVLFLALRARLIWRSLCLLSLLLAGTFILCDTAFSYSFSLFGATCVLLSLAVLALVRAQRDLQGFAGIARGIEDEQRHVMRLKKRGLITPLPDDMPDYFEIPPNMPQESLRLSWTAEGNLAAMRAILEAKMPVIAISGCKLSHHSLQVRSDPALFNYFRWHGKNVQQAAAEASEVLQNEPSMYSKELSLALCDYAYRPSPQFHPSSFDLPPEAVLLVPTRKQKVKLWSLPCLVKSAFSGK